MDCDQCLNYPGIDFFWKLIPSPSETQTGISVGYPTYPTLAEKNSKVGSSRRCGVLAADQRSGGGPSQKCCVTVAKQRAKVAEMAFA